MNLKNLNGSTRLSPLEAARVSWPSYLYGDVPQLCDYGLYLYLTFEDGSGNEWWPLEDGPMLSRTGFARPTASRQRSRRNGR